jgi:hypothetical protein
MANAHEKLVAERAGFRCEYCHFPAAFSGFRFVCDHIIAKKHEGSDEPTNLAYSCPLCNRHKLDNIAGLEFPSAAPVRLFHPRHDRWGDHFRCDGTVIVGLTAVGRVTIRVLKMNEAQRILARESLIPDGVSFE